MTEREDPDSAADELDPAALLGEDAEDFDAVLSGETAGPLAVVGTPYSGRGRVLDTAAIPAAARATERGRIL